jgi:oxaloacetate decarboxylase gamma subunit
MPISEQLLQGVELMLLGMGIVFTFLMVLVVVMTGMSRMAQAIDASKPQVASGPKAAAPGASEADIVAAISAAISRYRSTHK